MTDLFSDWSMLLPASLLFLLAVLFLHQIWRRDSYPYHAKGTLLSAAELHFFRTLEQAMTAEQMVAPKVRLGDVINCSGADWNKGHGPRISAKHLDFVIIDRLTSRILLAIELDDKSHDLPARKERDAFLNNALQAAGVPLLRIPAASAYDVAPLKNNIAKALRHDLR